MKSDLRKQAEEYRVTPERLPELTSDEVRKVIHELDVCQIELQKQNEELMRTLNELAASRDAYAELYHTAPVGYFECNQEGVVTRANQTLAKMLGVEREELEGRLFSDYVALISQDEWFLHRRELLGGACKLCSELELQPVGLGSIHVQLDYKLQPGDSDAEWRCMGTVTDITSRWMAETELERLYQNLADRVEERTAELRESEQRFSILFDEAPEACIVFDLTGRIHAVNRGVEQLSGYALDELAAMNFLESGVLEAESLPVIQAGMEQLARGEAVGTTRISIRRKDGMAIPVEGSACPILWGGQPMACAMVLDITERVAREVESLKNREELRRMSAELALAEERERRRIAESLHEDVGQLLGSSLIRLKLLHDETSSDGARGHVEAVIDTLKKTLDKTRTLTFDLSCPLLTQLGLAATLDELCRSMSYSCGVRFTFLCGQKRLPRLALEREFVLYRAARELMTNVIKHAAARNATVELSLLKGSVCLRIEDDGCGFDSAGGGRGFSPSGGFGLFSLQENIRHAGGRLKIESMPNSGTGVSISIPLEKEA